MRVLIYGIVALWLLPIMVLGIYRLDRIHPISTLMLRDWLSGLSYQRLWVRLDEVAPKALYSVVMAEDARFCRHHGVDWQELKQVLESPEGPKRGASTITMQVVKNLFLPSQPAYLRKIFEIPYALAADMLLSKVRILEIYLNVAEWGPGIYGIEAAARHYYGRAAKDLTQRQAALLVAILPSPHKRALKRMDPYVTSHARLIERRAAQSEAYVFCLREKRG
ncbi:transglycosylase domain-containing protein [Bartonella sp. DGB2]|uniref:transglycosylase domain-containing protein n=1 Tax=Bartonella sp. DGB2 TaxID=3388426 RepID=UPI00398FF67F